MFSLLGGVIVVAGCLVAVIGALGLLRFPDFFTRMHAASVTDTLAAGLVLLGLLLISGFSLASFKVLMIAALLLILNPTASHALAKLAMEQGQKPWQKGARSD